MRPCAYWLCSFFIRHLPHMVPHLVVQKHLESTFPSVTAFQDVLPAANYGSKGFKWYRIWKITGTWLWRIIAWLHKHGLSTDVKWFKHLTLTKRRSEDEFFRGPASFQNRVLSFGSRPGGGRTDSKVDCIRELKTPIFNVIPGNPNIRRLIIQIIPNIPTDRFTAL